MGPGPENPALHSRQIDGVSGASSVHTEIQFKIITASAAALEEARGASQQWRTGGKATLAPGAGLPCLSRKKGQALA